jgi:hypothetical protein
VGGTRSNSVVFVWKDGEFCGGLRSGHVPLRKELRFLTGGFEVCQGGLVSEGGGVVVEVEGGAEGESLGVGVKRRLRH